LGQNQGIKTIGNQSNKNGIFTIGGRTQQRVISLGTGQQVNVITIGDSNRSGVNVINHFNHV